MMYARVLLTAAVYFATAKLGLSLAVISPQVTVVWPPTGIALAVLVLWGLRMWPGVALGALLANLTTSAPLTAACGIAAGNTLEAIVGAILLRRLDVHTALDRLRDVLALVVTALLTTTVSATIGVTSLVLVGTEPWADFGSLWGAWWMGDVMGDLVMAPFLLVWATRPNLAVVRRRGREGAVFLALVVLACLIVFAGRPAIGIQNYPLHYAVFPLVVWAALRFRQLGTTTLTVAISALAIASTSSGLGPFSHGTQHENLILLQLFMAVAAVTGLLLGAAITERDAAEARRAVDFANLRVSEERLQLAHTAGGMGVWDWNIETGEVSWSENLEGMHGLARGGFDGTFSGFQKLVHPEDRAVVDEAIQRAVRDDTIYDIEFRNLWPDGTIHWMAARGIVMRDERGRPLRMLGVGLDVTERRRLAEELRQRADELAESDRRKDEFLAMLAHELRNPLAPLSTALHLLSNDDGARERFLGVATRQVKHLVRLVDDLLDASRITQGKVTLKKDRVQLRDVIERAVELVRPQTEDRGHALTVSLPPEPVILHADAVRLAQVVTNLLGNAAKYTPPGGSIWLTAERSGDEVVIRVRDTGVGLASDLIPRIFDLFVQGDPSLARTRGGLGIGLTLVRRLVELHGGRVEARSAGPGQGSEFVVRLPALPPILDAPTEVPPARQQEARGASLRILVVEDNVDAAEALAMVLTLWGHEVRIAYDGLAALQVAESYQADVIISDVGLPNMDGYEVARRLRAHGGYGQAVLIAISGYGRDEDKRLALEAGFDHHFVKPPDLDQLGDLLGRVAASAPAHARTLH
jgi:PAS domain S-box-containing protein